MKKNPEAKETKINLFSLRERSENEEIISIFNSYKLLYYQHSKQIFFTKLHTLSIQPFITHRILDKKPKHTVSESDLTRQS